MTEPTAATENIMSAMNRSQFVYVTFIRTTPAKLWQALTDPQFIRQYWFGVAIECGWVKGSPWTLSYPDGCVDTTGELLEIDPPRRMVIRWQNESKPELKAEGPSRCTIELEPAGSAVKLTITHESERPGSKLITAVSGGWPKVLSNLKSLLETGEEAIGNGEVINGYAPVNGLNMYYEIEGTGEPLVFIPAAHAHSGMRSFAELAQRHSVIKVDVQGQGRTADIPERPRTLAQDAEDIVTLLRHLGVSKADFFGESYGGATAVIIAVRHPELVRRVATFGATFGPAQVAHNPKMLRFDQPPTPDSRCFQFQRESYRKVAPEPDYWPQSWEKVGRIEWAGFTKAELTAIQAPVLVAVGDSDFVRVEHALETYELIPNAELAVIPDAGHFLLFSEQERLTRVVKHFLEKPEHRPPVATAGMGYQPGETR